MHVHDYKVGVETMKTADYMGCYGYMAAGQSSECGCGLDWTLSLSVMHSAAEAAYLARGAIQVVTLFQLMYGIHCLIYLSLWKAFFLRLIS